MKNNKTYEAPCMSVTVLKTDDVIMTSGALISLEEAKLMGKGKVKWIDIN